MEDTGQSNPADVTVSVILPVYNRAEALVNACQTVLSQSFDDLELIVVDDASTEDLAAVVESLNDTRVRYLRHEKNAGAAAARNTGLAVAKGRLIAFQDSDDQWLPGKLARQVPLLDSQPPDIGGVIGGRLSYALAGSGDISYAPDPSAPLKVGEDQVKRILERNRISLQTGLFRRDCYPTMEWFEPKAKANNDWEFAVRLVQQTKIYEEIHPVSLTFASDDSISRSSRKKLTGMIQILKKNRHLTKTHREPYYRHFYALGRGLSSLGKPTIGRKFMLRGIKESPSLLTYLLGRVLRGDIRTRS